MTAYCSASDVEGYTINILSGASGFDTSTSPTLAKVNQWISSGCGIIETTLAGAKYVVPVASGTAAFDWLRNLNAYYGAAQVEFSRTNITLGPGERTRGQVFDQLFWQGLDRIVKGDLTLSGLSRTPSGKLYVGGISRSDKQTVESDSDRVPSRFGRGQFASPGRIEPTPSTGSSSE